MDERRDLIKILKNSCDIKFNKNYLKIPTTIAKIRSIHPNPWWRKHTIFGSCKGENFSFPFPHD
jgi:hypothetical protein